MQTAYRSISISSDYLWRVSVERYHQMIRSGMLTENDPVELIEGIITVKMPKDPAYSKATRFLRRLIARQLPAGWFVDSQEPITTADSEPEPDLFVAREDDDDYGGSHPTPADLALVIEVSNSTLAQDRGLKREMYARAGIPVYWIVNLVDKQMEISRFPGGATKPAYGETIVYHADQKVPLEISGKLIAELDVNSIFK